MFDMMSSGSGALFRARSSKPKYKNIPIIAAKNIANQYDKDQVIIVTWDQKFGKMHVTTYGKTLGDCDNAARGGNLIKRALGFSEELCNAVPARVKRKSKKNLDKEFAFKDYKR